MNLAILFVWIITLVFPISVGLYAWIWKRNEFKFWILGVLCFVIFQILLRIPLIQIVLSQQVWFILLSAKSPLGYLFFLSLTAALFEEMGRYLIFKFFMKKVPLKSIIYFGLGHGGIEAFLLVGLAYVFQDLSAVPQLSVMYAGIERISAMILHVSLSLWVYESIRLNSKLGLGIALILHLSFNYIAIFMVQLGLSFVYVEGFIALSSIMSLFVVLKVRNSHDQKTLAIL